MAKLKEGQRIRPDVISFFGIILIISFMILRIVLTFNIDAVGMGFFAIPFEIYMLSYCVFVFSFRMSVSSMLRTFLKRNQEKNAKKVMKLSFRRALLGGIICAILTVILAMVLSSHIIKMQLLYLPMLVASVCILLMSVQGVFRGFLEGTGKNRTIIHSMIIQGVLSILFAVLFARYFTRYGLKLNALLGTDLCAPAYGALGAMVGLAAALFVSLIHIAGAYKLRLLAIERAKSGDSLRGKNSDLKINSLPGQRSFSAMTGMPVLLFIADFIIYVIFFRLRGEGGSYMESFGIMYGNFLPIVFIITLVLSLVLLKSDFKLCAQVAHADFALAGDNFSEMIHKGLMLFLYGTAFVAIMAEPLETTFFGIPDDAAVGMISFGSVIVLFGAFAVNFTIIMARFRRSSLIVLNSAIPAVVHLISIIVLSGLFGLGLHAVIASMAIMLIVYDYLCFFEISKIIHYKQEWIHSVAVTLISCGISALIMYFLNGIFVNLVGEILSIVLCLVLTTLIYLCLLVVLKGIDEFEIYALPGGDKLADLLKAVHILR